MPYHRLTYPKGVHSFRYFPYENTIVACSCIYAFCLVIAIGHSMRTPNMSALSGNCNSQAKCIYTWADNKRIWQNEYMHEQIWCTHWVEDVPEWLYNFWVCKPVIRCKKGVLHHTEKKVEPKRLHPWSRFMVRNSGPPLALFWCHLQRWSCFCLKKGPNKLT